MVRIPLPPPGLLPEWINGRAWKARGSQGPVGSNPTVSARNDGRAVECARLESGCAARHRGFESFSFRQEGQPLAQHDALKAFGGSRPLRVRLLHLPPVRVAQLD